MTNTEVDLSALMKATGKLITPVSIGTSQDVNVAVQVAEEVSSDL